MADNLDTDEIKNWRSIVTLIVFVITNVIVLFPFHVPIYIPRQFLNATLDTLSALRVISPRQTSNRNDSVQPFVRLNFPLNFITAPLIADLFLLAILAIGRKEVHDGTLGADNIYPIDIMAFFLSLAYIAISIDASGLIRFLAFKVLQKGGKVGHKLFFYLYAFFFGLGSFIGNDPIILSGTAFLAYMTRVSSNIIHPRAWIHTQFAVANIASAILVSSNPTNLVLANAFNIKFITYTANMIVPVVVTAIVLFPFLLYIVFADKSLIPISIKMHELSEEAKAKKPVNPNIPHARGNADEQENDVGNDQDGKLLSLEEIMNPFVDKGGAVFGAVIMTATLVTLLALNAASQRGNEHPVFWVTLPAAFVMFCWDVAFGWYHRHETREIARKGRMEVENARAERAHKEKEEAKQTTLERDEQDAMSEPYASVLARTHSQESQLQRQSTTAHPTNAIAADNECTLDEDKSRSTPPLMTPLPSENGDGGALMLTTPLESSVSTLLPRDDPSRNFPLPTTVMSKLDEKQELSHTAAKDSPPSTPPAGMESGGEMAGAKQRRPTLVSLINDGYTWLQETFPTVTAVMAHLPFALVPFTFCMFILVQGLVSKGWVSVFAYGWDHWVKKTGTVGSIGGIGFLSVILCNFAGTNIGTSILLSRVIQAWKIIHENNGTDISDRTFWATVYGMALGVNYGAFSAAFSASLAGLLWRDILARKYIRVKRLEFARVNLPIIAISMAVGCTVLIGEVYIVRDERPYNS